MALRSDDRPKSLGGRISSRLVLLGLLNLAGFALIVAILILAFRSVEQMTSEAAEDQMARATTNAFAMRQVSGLYPLTRVLTAALHEPDGHLALAGAELRRTVEGIAAGDLSPAARATIKALSEQLAGFVAEGERTSALIAEVDAQEARVHAAVAQLEEALTALRLDTARSGMGDDRPLAELQRLLGEGRERLHELSRHQAARPDQPPAQTSAAAPPPGELRGAPILPAPPAAIPVIADLGRLLQGVAAAAPSLHDGANRARADLDAYGTAEHALAEGYAALAEDLRRLREAEKDSLRLMSQLDLDTSAQADELRRRILDIMLTSAVYAVALALVVGLAVVLLILVILRRQIKEPMEGVIARVNAISGGAFDRLKPSGRGDEWDAIQTALTDMAAELARTHRALAENEARYRIIVENQGDLVVKLDPEQRLVFANPSLCETLGMSEGELLGRPWLPLIHPDDAAGVGTALALLAPTPHHTQIEQRTQTPKGLRWYAWAYRAVRGEDGAPEAVIGVGRDITDRKAAEAEVEAQRSFLHTVIDAVPDPVLVVGVDREVRLANAAAQRLYDLGDAPAGGRGACCHQLTHRSPSPCGGADLVCPLEQALASGTSVRALHRHHLGCEERYMEVTASPYWGPEDRIEGIVEVGRDITDQLAAQERIQFLAHHDVLTGLPNRALLYERFAAAAQARDGGGDGPRIGLLYLDLDDFKRINDTLGHHVGDLLLQEVARRLSAAVRKTDTVSRQGGDEFLVVLPGLQNAEGAVQVAEHIAATLEAPIRVDGHELRATFSIGVAVLPEDGTDLDTLRRNADLAMYAAKAGGRNTIRRFAPTMERRTSGSHLKAGLG